MRGSYTRRQIGALLGATPLAISVLPIFSQSAWAADDALQTAIDAYIYGYSLITTEVTRVQMSNVPQAEGIRAPIGNSSTSSVTRPPIIAAFRRPMRTRFIRWPGWTLARSRSFSAIRTWDIGFTYSR